MKKSIRIGFPIFCVVVVGGTLIALVNLSNKVEKISEQRALNEVKNTITERYEEKEEKHNYKLYNQTNSENIIQNTNTIKNTNTDTNVSKNVIEENTVKNNVQNNVQNSNTTTNSVSNSKIDSTEETDEADNLSDKNKAISMVQAEWGSDPTVYFTNEGMSSGNYIVAVRDKSNTSVKMFYKVNIEANTVEIDW